MFVNISIGSPLSSVIMSCSSAKEFLAMHFFSCPIKGVLYFVKLMG